MPTVSLSMMKTVKVRLSDLKIQLGFFYEIKKAMNLKSVQLQIAI